MNFFSTKIIIGAASASAAAVAVPAYIGPVTPCGTPATSQISTTVTATPAPAPGTNLYDGFDGYAREVTTQSAEAQRWFDQGIQLLYGFNHDEAIRSFERAAEVDPNCAMAWWGAAYARGLHINNPAVGEEASRAAYRSAKRAVATLDDETPVERALVHAVAKRFAEPLPEDRAPHEQAYAEAMEQAWHEFPGDADVGALYAESLMNLQPWDLWTGDGEPKGRVLEILGILDRTLAKHPQHPGANHFFIHAIEASPWPQRGTAAAERLVGMVPGSGHLVHMPSHIFMRTGRYAEAADANARAIASDEAYFAEAPEPDFYSLYFMHNVHFLAYAAMMEGRYETAIEAAGKIRELIPPEFLENYVTIADGFMPTALHVQIRFGKWDDILAEAEPPAWRLISRAERHFARAVALAKLGRIDEAQAELEAFDAVAAEVTDEWYVGNNPAHEVLAVARAMAGGEVAYFAGDKDRAFELLRDAVGLEEGLTYDEPPGWMQPVRHALGALLLREDRAAEAERVYRADLLRHPENAWSLLGLKQSLEAQAKEEAVAELAPRVAAAWARADAEAPASCYCAVSEQ